MPCARSDAPHWHIPTGASSLAGKQDPLVHTLTRSWGARATFGKCLLMCSFIKGIDKLFGYSATKFAIRALTQSAGTQLCGGFFSRAATDPTLDGSARELG